MLTGFYKNLHGGTQSSTEINGVYLITSVALSVFLVELSVTVGYSDENSNICLKVQEVIFYLSGFFKTPYEKK